MANKPSSKSTKLIADNDTESDGIQSNDPPISTDSTDAPSGSETPGAVPVGNEAYAGEDELRNTSDVTFADSESNPQRDSAVPTPGELAAREVEGQYTDDDGVLRDRRGNLVQTGNEDLARDRAERNDDPDYIPGYSGGIPIGNSSVPQLDDALVGEEVVYRFTDHDSPSIAPPHASPGYRLTAYLYDHPDATDNHPYLVVDRGPTLPAWIVQRDHGFDNGHWTYLHEAQELGDEPRNPNPQADDPGADPAITSDLYDPEADVDDRTYLDPETRAVDPTPRPTT